MSKSGFGGSRVFEVFFRWTRSFITSLLAQGKLNLSMNSGIRRVRHVNFCGLGVGVVRGFEGEVRLMLVILVHQRDIGEE